MARREKDSRRDELSSARERLALGVLEHQQPHPFERRNGWIPRDDRWFFVLSRRHRAEGDGDGQSDQPAKDAHGAFSQACGEARSRAYTYCADFPSSDKSGGAPLPSQPPVPYIVPAVREGGYGDKLASK